MRTFIFFLLMILCFNPELNSQIVSNNNILPANNKTDLEQYIHQWSIGYFGNHFIFPENRFTNTVNEYNSVVIYPNPTTGLLNIQQTEQEQLYYEIWDNIGRNIITKQPINGHSTLDLSTSKKGIYFIKLYTQSHDQISIKKIIKI